MKFIDNIKNWYFKRKLKSVSHFISPMESFELTFPKGWTYKPNERLGQFYNNAFLGVLVVSLIAKSEKRLNAKKKLKEIKKKHSYIRKIKISKYEFLECMEEVPDKNILTFHYYLIQEDFFFFATYTTFYMSPEKLDLAFIALMNVLSTLKINRKF